MRKTHYEITTFPKFTPVGKHIHHVHVCPPTHLFYLYPKGKRGKRACCLQKIRTENISNFQSPKSIIKISDTDL